MKCFLIQPAPDEEKTHEFHWKKFPEEDHEWIRLETGERKLLHEWEAGAMYYAPWIPAEGLSIHWKKLPEEEKKKGALICKTPGGFWCIDRPSTGGDGWVREGTAPSVTVRPSIFHDPPRGWHGWLRNGELTSV